MFIHCVHYFNVIFKLFSFFIQFFKTFLKLYDDLFSIKKILHYIIMFFSYLEQAAQAGRLEEVEILEKNLLDLETEMKRMQLPTPRLAA